MGKEEGENGKRIIWGGLLGKEKCVKSNEDTWLATKKKKIFLSPGFFVVVAPFQELTGFFLQIMCFCCVHGFRMMIPVIQSCLKI